MQQSSSHGIVYSSEHFTSEFIDWLVQSPTHTALLLAEPALADDVVLTNDTPESVFAAAWAEVSADPELAEALQQAGYTRDKGFAEFTAALARPLPDAADRQVSAALTVDYQVQEQDDAFVHSIDGEQVLAIPKSVEAAPMVSTNAQAVMYGIFIVIDVLSVIAAAASVSVMVNKARIAKSLQGPLNGFLRKLFNPAAVRKLEELAKTGKKIDLIQKVLGTLRGSVNLKTVVTTFLESMSVVEKGIAVAQLVASILALLATAGASLAAKILQLVAAVAMLVTDIITFVRAVRNPQAAG